jgi:amino acid permease
METKTKNEEEDQDLVYERIKDNKFKQQCLPAWRPVPTIEVIVIVFGFFGVFLIVLGSIMLSYSNEIKTKKIRYDQCQLSTLSTCQINFILNEEIKKTVFVYYELDGYFQNHRRYLKSKSTYQ